MSRAKMIQKMVFSLAEVESLLMDLSYSDGKLARKIRRQLRAGGYYISIARR